MFVEIFYGLASNSLGLLSDGAHMLLDCSAVFIGALSRYLSSLPPDKNYLFGYKRSEPLGTFINAIFLVFIAIYIVLESIVRLIHPVDIHTDNLLLVSFLGLLVNLIGIFFFHDVAHEHGSCNHDHDEESGGHHDESNSNNENLYAIYLHILADTLGSVGVMISSYLIKHYGLLFTDPLCSFCLSILIIYSSWPVLKQSAKVLLYQEDAKARITMQVDY